MSHSHGHSHVGEGGARPPSRALTIAFVLTLVAAFAQLVGAWVSKSLALFSDASHMFSDAAALAIALLAARLAMVAATKKFSFGFHRFEIFAALVNALMLFGIAGYIAYEAWQRIQNPSATDIPITVVVALFGLVANFISLRVLMHSGGDGLNIRAATLEVWSDLIGSIGVIVSAVVMYFTQWRWLDPLVAVMIAVFVLPRAWGLFRESVEVLLEATPTSIDLAKVAVAISAVAGVVGIHDLHIWCITSGKNCLTAHAVVEDLTRQDDILVEVRQMLHREFNITHTTIQIETSHCAQSACSIAVHHDNSDQNMKGHTHV